MLVPRVSRARVGGVTVAVLAASTALLSACSAPGDESLGTTRSAAGTAFPNDKTAYDYFASKGLTNYQAAGIVGNLDQESGVDPTAVEANGPGRGIAQWSVGGRWDTDSGDNVLAYATQQGESSSSLTLQLDFIWFELQSFPDYGLAALKASTNVTDATVAFEDSFEECSACDESTRISYAEDILAAYGNDPVLVDAGSVQDGAPVKDAGDRQDAAVRDAFSDAPSSDDASAPGAPGTTGDFDGSASDSGQLNGSGDSPALTSSGSSSGCRVGPVGARGSNVVAWLLSLALAFVGARRRRS
jgi:MYXO-CTERM domain-containing protein